MSALSGGPMLEADFELIIKQCDELEIEWEDNRHKNGAFWVMLPDRSSNRSFVTFLEMKGFNFSPNNKGFWYKPR